jgi:hypothetical protein
VTVRGVLLGLLACAAGCSPAVQPHTQPEPDDAPPTPAPTATAEDPAAEPELAEAIAAVVSQLGKARKLRVKHVVAGRRISRAAAIERLKAKIQRELPKGVLEAQGEMLRGLGLVPEGYDFVGGVYGLLEKNIAGFYDDDDRTMFVLDDLSLEAAEETLVHELEHAVQDQHFELGKMLDYRPGDSDRVAAGQNIAEGDAMAAMFEVTAGSAFNVDIGKLRFAMIASVALTEGGETPRVLQSSLVVPYIDGFRFVQGLRERGDWEAVDDAFRKLPFSTEQLLHLDKYDVREPPVAVPEPPQPAAGWSKQDADVLGEQGLRIVLEQWASDNDEAAQAAAGWGGDRYLVAQREGAQGREQAVAWHVRFDSDAEAREAAAVVTRELPACSERTTVGPIAWKARGDALAFVAGPWLRDRSGTLTSQSNCAEAQAWLDKVLAAR